MQAALSRRFVVWLGLAALLTYAVWMAGPYLRSIVVRDAAVSTWVHVAAAPIDGIISEPLRVGDRIGADRRIAVVENPRADTTEIARATAALEEARTRVASLGRVVAENESLVRTRLDRASEYAATFKRNLDVKIGGMTDYVRVSKERLALERTEANRQATLVTRGTQPQSEADAARKRAADLELAVIDMQTSLERATLHRRMADDGLFMLDDGSDGADMQRSLEDARLALDRARADLAVAQKAMEAAQQVFDQAQRLFETRQKAGVLGQTGGVVWSADVTTGSAVVAGNAVATWIDCRVMLVDAAVSDAELSLLRPGRPADIVLEGERRARRGKVLLLRGSASTLTLRDLVAVAKGRTPGVGQAIVALDPTADDVEACPVGRAAFVYFPDATVLDIVRARLRW